MRKPIAIRQHDSFDCGPTCLVSLFGYYGYKIPITQIRQLTHTDTTGTSVMDMVNAAIESGFLSKAMKADIASLDKIPSPAIAHVHAKNNEQHYMVIHKVKRDKVVVMDPAIGKMAYYTKKEWSNMWSGILILCVPDEGFERLDLRKSIVKRIWYLVFPHKWILLQALFGAVIFTMLGLTTAIYIQKIIDFVIPNSNTSLLNLLSIAMIILVILRYTVNIFKDIFIQKLSTQLDIKIIYGYFKHLLRLPQKFFDSMRVGEITSRINDALKIRMFVSDVGMSLLVNIILILFSFALMFTYYWKMALIVLLILPLFLIIFIIANRINRKRELEIMENAAEFGAISIETLNLIKTVKHFGLHSKNLTKIELKLLAFLKSNYNSSISNTSISNTIGLLSAFLIIIVFWIGGVFVTRGLLSPGELISFYAIVGFFIDPALKLTSSNKFYQGAKIAASRLFEILDLKTEKQEDVIILEKEDIGDIELRNIDFKYGNKSIFKNFSLCLKKGEITAIIGESGSGKSSIASLLKRIYDIHSGEIFIGKYDLALINEDSLSRLVGIVPQQIELISGTLAENVSLNQYPSNADFKKIVELAHFINAVDFIQELPGTLGCYLGEGGVQLSEGQKQRIGLMRALFNEPAILILDEPTAALDYESESAILSTIRKMNEKGTTVIYISHNLETIDIADRVVVLKNGEIMEEGTYDELSLTSSYLKNYHQKH